MNHNHLHDDVTPSLTAIAFPPVPLACGEALINSQGADHPIVAMRLTVSTADGLEVEIPLDFRFGGWWAPRNATALLTVSE